MSEVDTSTADLDWMPDQETLLQKVVFCLNDHRVILFVFALGHHDLAVDGVVLLKY